MDFMGMANALMMLAAGRSSAPCISKLGSVATNFPSATFCPYTYYTLRRVRGVSYQPLVASFGANDRIQSEINLLSELSKSRLCELFVTHLARQAASLSRAHES